MNDDEEAMKVNIQLFACKNYSPVCPFQVNTKKKNDVIFPSEALNEIVSHSQTLAGSPGLRETMNEMIQAVAVKLTESITLQYGLSAGKLVK